MLFDKKIITHPTSTEINEIYTAPLLLRDLAINECLQERLEKYEAPTLSNTELLAILLRSGPKKT